MRRNKGASTNSNIQLENISGGKSYGSGQEEGREVSTGLLDSVLSQWPPR